MPSKGFSKVLCENSVITMLPTSIHSLREIKRFLITAFVVAAAASFILMLSQRLAAETLQAGDEAKRWEEIASLRYQAAREHDLQGDVRKEGAFRQREPYDTLTSGDELDFAGDEKYLASEDYQAATKQWQKAAKIFRTAGDLINAKRTMDYADGAWEAARKSLREGVEIYKMAHRYYETANGLEKKPVVLGKVARNLERLIDMKR
jgi:tetratricopeptide (TPR) repeat protein